MKDETDLFWPFRLLGQIAVDHSNLEHMVAVILEHLVNEETGIAAGILTEDLPFAKKLPHLNGLARLRFPSAEDRPVLDRIETFVKEADKVRIERNAFVHGFWRYDPGDAAKGFIECSEGKWKHTADGSISLWKRLQRKEWTEAELMERHREVAALVKEAFGVRDAVQEKLTGSRPGHLIGRVSAGGQNQPRMGT